MAKITLPNMHSVFTDFIPQRGQHPGDNNIKIKTIKVYYCVCVFCSICILIRLKVAVN